LEGPGKPVGTEIEWDTSVLAYAYDVNLLGDNIDTIKKKTETLIHASKEIGLEVNVEKTNVCCCLITAMQVKICTSK
jgi:hypothetical protein